MKLRWPWSRRPHPETTVVQEVNSMMVAAVSVQFIAQAEADFGADWQEKMRSLSPSQREAWIARNFPDRV